MQWYSKPRGQRTRNRAEKTGQILSRPLTTTGLKEYEHRYRVTGCVCSGSCSSARLARYERMLTYIYALRWNACFV